MQILSFSFSYWNFELKKTLLIIHFQFSYFDHIKKHKMVAAAILEGIAEGKKYFKVDDSDIAGLDGIKDAKDSNLSCAL